MKPEQVIFPQKRWRLNKVIHTGKGGHWSLARGDWGNNEGKLGERRAGHSVERRRGREGGVSGGSSSIYARNKF